MIGLSTGWMGICSLATARSPAVELVDAHHFVAAWINDLDGHSFVFARRKRQRHSSAQRGKAVGINHAIQRLAQFVPCIFVGEESLRDAERSAIVVAVNEPRGYFGGV